MIPQNNSTLKLFVFNTVVLGFILHLLRTADDVVREATPFGELDALRLARRIRVRDPRIGICSCRCRLEQAIFFHTRTHSGESFKRSAISSTVSKPFSRSRS